MKRCTRCKEYKDESCYTKESRRGDGLSPACRACKKVYNDYYHKKNRDKQLAYMKKRYHENKEYYFAHIKRWRKENPHKVIEYSQRRRARKLGNGGGYTAAEWEELCDSYGNMCLACKAEGIPLTVDHIIPLSKGGPNDISNLQPLCGSCNTSKGIKIIDYRPEITATEQRKESSRR